MTRALCYDADTPGDWRLLQEAVMVLAESGSIPLLEVSPVGRGGHLWIIYTGLVSADQARGNIVELAPRLKEIAESWPGSGSRTSKVRLPGGKYVKPVFASGARSPMPMARCLQLMGEARLESCWTTKHL